jgi:hypothetical protein
MEPKPDPQDPGDTNEKTESESEINRREFLRTSVYAAYATPLITTLLVTRTSAAQSPGNACSNDNPLIKNPNCQ